MIQWQPGDRVSVPHAALDPMVRSESLRGPVNGARGTVVGVASNGRWASVRLDKPYVTVSVPSRWMVWADGLMIRPLTVIELAAEAADAAGIEP